jgi:hypothetical protein
MRYSGRDIQSYLSSLGYEPFRWSQSGLVRDPYPGGFFSTAGQGRDMPSAIVTIWKRGVDKVVYGIGEHGKPPTLLSPLPIGCHDQDTTDRILACNSAKDVYRSMFRLSSKPLAQFEKEKEKKRAPAWYKNIVHTINGENRRARIRKANNEAVLKWLRMDTNAEMLKVRQQLESE